MVEISDFAGKINGPGPAERVKYKKENVYLKSNKNILWI